ncbi:MAG: hypothetical protein SGJ20_21490 [Planctomycetota bacterium]|nr:hypothetical protein [Planctomycetota bacterium]
MVNGIWIFVLNRKIDAQIAAIKEAGHPASLADLAAIAEAEKKEAAKDPASDAATYLRKIDKTVDAMNSAEAKFSDELETQQKNAVEAESDSSKVWQPEWALREEIDFYRKLLAANPEVLSAIQQASICERYSSPSIYAELKQPYGSEAYIESLIPKVTHTRTYLIILSYQFYVQMTDGKREEAVETCLTMLRLARLFEKTPTLLGYLVVTAQRSMAIHFLNVALRNGPLPADVYRQIESELSKHDPPPLFRKSLISERALGITAFDDMPAVIHYVAWFKGDYPDFLNLQESAIQVIATQNSSVNANEFFKQTDKETVGILTGLALSGWISAGSAAVRDEIYFNTARVLNAIEARLAAGQSLPSKLSELNLPTKVITDPFTGKELKFRQTPLGLVIYSVGPNLDDDNEDIKETWSEKDIGIGPAFMLPKSEPTPSPAPNKSE